MNPQRFAKRLLIAAALVALLPSCGASEVCSGDKNVSNADDLVRLAECRSIQGSLVINATGSELNALDALRNLETIRGRLIIRNTALTELRGFDNLASVDTIDISGNDELFSIRAFPRLVRAGLISIEDNRALYRIHGLDALQEADSIRITDNGNLSEVWGFNSVTRLHGPLLISQPWRLRYVDGFRHLVETDGDVTIDGAFGDGFETVGVHGFDSLRSLGPSPDATLFIVTERISGFAGAGPVWEHNLEVTSLAAEDAFNGIEVIEGDLVANISDAAFANLRRIDGDLIIDDAIPPDVVFDKLESVRDLTWTTRGGFHVSGFNGLVEARDILITPGQNMLSITGFAGLERVQSLQLGGDPIYRPFQELDGFNSLATVGRRLRISGLNEMTTLSGFNALETVGLDAAENDQGAGIFLEVIEDVETFDALKNLDDVQGTVHLYAVGPGLPSWPIRELDTLHVEKTNVGDLSSFAELERVGTLRVVENRFLNTMEMEALVEVRDVFDFHANHYLDCDSLNATFDQLEPPLPEIVSVTDFTGPRCGFE